MKYDAFAEDPKTCRDCVSSLSKISDDAQDISTAFQSTYDNIPWADIDNFKNTIAENDPKKIWQILNNNVPILFKFTEFVLKNKPKTV
jgi:uncharacterized protein with HEPN domain